jgi:hypothetical protein
VLEILIRISSAAVDGGPQVLSESELVDEVSYSWEKNGLGRIALSTGEPISVTVYQKMFRLKQVAEFVVAYPIVNVIGLFQPPGRP